MAAGECLGLIAEHCQHHTPADLLKAAGVVDAVKAEPGDHANGANPGSQDSGEADAPLSFQNFRIEQVMEKGSLLLASGGTVRAGSVSLLTAALRCSAAISTAYPCQSPPALVVTTNHWRCIALGRLGPRRDMARVRGRSSTWRWRARPLRSGWRGMGGKLDELMETDKLIKDEDLLLAEGPTAPGKKGKESTEAAELLTNMEGAAKWCPGVYPARVML